MICTNLYSVLTVPLYLFLLLFGDPGAAGPRLFTIHQIDANTDNLPKAHTWWEKIQNLNFPLIILDYKTNPVFNMLHFSFLYSFNRIDIPPYEHYDKLYDKLLTAIEETCGFAVEWFLPLEGMQKHFFVKGVYWSLYSPKVWHGPVILPLLPEEGKN